MDEKQRNRMINKEIKLLTEITKDIPEEKATFAKRLIDEAAFMYVTLCDLKEQINVKGAVELFINGAQTMLREHPASKIYNTTIKNYNSTMKALGDLLPTDVEEEDELDKLLNKRKQCNG